ncbi:hypothetical protein FOZ63_003825 [Perkinsus olseni]|uniref:Uncharacterized protein n=1 Tax=Perkinsus olseni TaxID=32597 RepID=A0A7J6T6U3_PEROL|nr:hypothetical protein FOZ63_003825 [Perkinsus olseni]KAF4740146.1 hypothetical protein FOZ62_009584 [Perkinsus olseni]
MLEATETTQARRKTLIRPVFEWGPTDGLQGPTPVIDRDLVAAISYDPLRMLRVLLRGRAQLVARASYRRDLKEITGTGTSDVPIQVSPIELHLQKYASEFNKRPNNCEKRSLDAWREQSNLDYPLDFAVHGLSDCFGSAVVASPGDGRRAASGQ